VIFLITTINVSFAASYCHCENGGDCIYDNNGFKQCKCPKGWTGRYCTESVECSNLHCFNGGRCVNSNGRSQCVCVNGYSGQQCEINNDDCASNPCSLGTKRCIDGVGSFTCLCEKGYTGLLCQLRDGCASNPCHASATCYANPTNGSAMCACPKGYKGEDCSIDINECDENGSPCEHGGTCVNTEGSFKCDCPLGFAGSRCEININECQSNPCLNEGTCLDEIGGYRCICVPGYTGQQCETDIDECIDKPCSNNGVCTNLINGYRCLCPNGFNGTKCEINEDDCANSPCANGGKCIDGIAQYTCQCAAGWTGHNCEVNINECLSTPCEHGGQCIDGINSYACVCQPGFTGDRCEININECSSSPCLHGGQCVDLVNGFKCECPLGTSGVRCEYNTNECWSNPCRHDSICHDRINGYDCECKPGYTGLNCEIDIDECASSPCANGGKCYDLPNAFKCACPRGFYDARCLSDVNECDPNPCFNGARCEDDVNKFICHCLPGFTGPRCELEQDACASSPCQHNGQCINYMGNYKCVCPAEFTGKSCEINISDCNASLFGDCLLGYKINPWANCTQASFCWKAFSDGVCNEVCNNKECLFDGMDCLHKQKNSGSNNQYIVDNNNHQNQDVRLNGKRRQCDPEFDSYCQRNYQNGFCDQGCNNEQCGWDGLDCLEINQKNGIKQHNYAELPYVARGSLFITLDLPVNKISLSNSSFSKSAIQKSDERPIFAILRALSQIVGTTLRVKQNYNDGSFSLKSIIGDNGENMTEVEVIADNTMCEYDCFDTATQIANYLAAFQARTNELSHQFGQSSKFALKSIRAQEADSFESSQNPKDRNDATSMKTWFISSLIIIFIGLMLGVLIANKEKKMARGITWFPEGFRSEGSVRSSIATYQAAGGNYLRKPLGKLRGNFNKMDRKPDAQEMSKTWLHHETIHENKELNSTNNHSHVIYEEPKDPRPWSTQHYEAYGDGTKNGPNCANSNNILMPLPMPSNLKELLHPGLRQTQNMMQTKADTDASLTNGLLSPPLVNSCISGGVDVVGPSGLTPLMVAAAYRGVVPYCGVGGDECTQQNESTKLLENNNNCIELMDTHNGPGSAGSSVSTNNGPTSSSSMIDELISQGASVDKKMENTGETSLHLAARFSRADAVKRLLEAKADCNAEDFSGRTPLHTAIAADALGAFEILIRNRATSLNAKSKDGNTPLILAVRNCSDQMMIELINAGADINATDNSQRTALHWAAMVSNLKGLKILIEHGANKDAQDDREQTPIFLAAREGAFECVKTLLEYGANKEITDHMDVTPKKVAESKFHKDIIQLLDGNIPITITNVNNTNLQNESNSPAVANSPKKSINNNENTNTAKRAKKQQTNNNNKQVVTSNQTQAKFIQQQQQPQQQRPSNASDLLQQAANVNNGTLKKGQQIVQQIQQINPNSALNQHPPPLPPPRPQLQPVTIINNNNNNNNKMQKNQIVNLPQLPQNSNLLSPFDYMMHTPLTPTTCNAPNINMNQQQPVQLTIPNSIAINSPSNHVLLSPNNTVLMSPPHSSVPAHYLGKPPPYESINHCTQISNATYMHASQWKPEPNYYTIYNTTNHQNDSYLTPSPDSPSNWSAASVTSPATSNGDWLELQTPQQQQQQQVQMQQQMNTQLDSNQQIVNNSNQQVVNMIDVQQQQQQMIDQQQLSPPEQFNNQINHQDQLIQHQQMTQSEQSPPTYQTSCNQQQQQQPTQQQTIVVNTNTRQITSTQQSVFL